MLSLQQELKEAQADRQSLAERSQQRELQAADREVNFIPAFMSLHP